MARPLEILIIVLLLVWLVGAFVVPVGGRMIHQLLVLAMGLAALRVLLALGLLPHLKPTSTSGESGDEDIRLPR